MPSQVGEPLLESLVWVSGAKAKKSTVVQIDGSVMRWKVDGSGGFPYSHGE